MNMVPVASGAASVMGVVSGGILGGALHAIAGELVTFDGQINTININHHGDRDYIVKVEVFLRTSVLESRNTTSGP